MRIAIVGPFLYPSSNANSQRIKGIVDALGKFENEIMIFPGMISTEADVTYPSKHEGNIEIKEINEYKSGFASDFKPGIRGLFIGDITVQWLQSMQRKPNVVILYGTHLGYLLRLINFCRKKAIKLILDVVEWYDPWHLPGGPFGPIALTNEISMRWGVQQADGLFVISSYLEKYYTSKGCRTLRVPPIFSEFPARPQQFREKNGLLNLCYVGSPGKKEEFRILFEGIKLAVSSGVKLKMHFIGISEKDFTLSFPNTLFLTSSERFFLEFYGRLENKEARQIVSSSDFLMLARKQLKFANAGFPFKVSESMTLGTPVITNVISDVGDYIQDGINSYLLKSLSAVSVKDAIELAYRQDENLRISMQRKAFQMAKENFSSEVLAEKINDYLTSLNRKDRHTLNVDN